MFKQYSFEHTCGHTAIGPRIHSNPTLVEDDQLAAPDTSIEGIYLYLSFRCPFCADTQPYLNVAPGDGLLALLESIPDTSFAEDWRIIRVCRPDEILPHDWYLAHGPEGQYRQMAWIPKPCGALTSGIVEVRMGDDNLRETTMEVGCSWRQRFGQPVRTRLAGIFSELNARLAVGENDGRY